MPPVEIGKFLKRWIEAEPLWTPTRIELLHDSAQREADRYRVSLCLSSKYFTDGREGGAP